MIWFLLFLSWPIVGWTFSFLEFWRMSKQEGYAIRLYHLFFIFLAGLFAGWFMFLAWLEHTHAGDWIEKKLDKLMNIKITSGE